MLRLQRRDNLKLMLLLMWTPFFSYADFQVIPRTEFKTITGQFTEPRSELSKTDRLIFVSFWADWCVACKHELSLLSENIDSLDNLKIIAINVDDDFGWGASSAFRETLDPRILVLRDIEGEVFFSLSPTGILPTSILFDAKSEKTIKQFGQFNHSELNEIKTILKSSNSSEEGSGFQSGASVRAKVKTRRKRGNQKFAAARTLTSTFNLQTNQWTLKLRHLALWQKLPQNETYSSREDELGESYIQYTSTKEKKSSSRLQVRLGGGQVRLLGGLVSSIKTDPATSDHERLDGLHSTYTNSELRLGVFGGRVRNQLYPALLDPTQDLSVRIPRQDFAGIEASWARNIGENGRSFSLSVAAGALNQDADLDLGLESHKDKRIGGGIETKLGMFEVQARGVRFEETKASQTATASILSSAQKWSPSWHSDISLSKTTALIDRFNFHQVSALTDDYARPLENSNKNSKRVGLHGNFKTTSLQPYFDTSWTEETRNKNETNPEKASHFGLKAGSQKWHVKSQNHITIQKFKLEPNDQKVQERVHTVTFPIYKDVVAMSAQTRRYELEELDSDEGRDVHTVSGERNSGGIQISHSLYNIKLQLGYDHAHQTGFYVSESGIKDGELQLISLEALHDGWSISTRYGEQPGGIICTAGNCSFRAGHDGWLVEASVNAQF